MILVKLSALTGEEPPEDEVKAAPYKLETKWHMD
jgi:hypothetical protein